MLSAVRVLRRLLLSEQWLTYPVTHSFCNNTGRQGLHASFCWEILWLNVRQKKLSIQYSLKLSSYPQNPSYNTVFNSKFKVSFERKPHQIPPLGIRIQPDLCAVGFFRRNVLKCSIPANPPSVFKWPHIDYSIHQSFKDNTSPEIYKNKFFEFCDHYKDFSQLYADGSRMGNQVAAALQKYH